MLQTPRWSRSRGPCAQVDTQGWTRDLGAAVRRAHRCVARRVARSHSSQPAVLQTPGLITPGKGPDTSPTPDGDARRGVRPLYLNLVPAARRAARGRHAVASVLRVPQTLLNGADVHQCWLRALLLEAQAKKKDRTNRGPSNGDRARPLRSAHGRSSVACGLDRLITKHERPSRFRLPSALRANQLAWAVSRSSQMLRVVPVR